MTETPAAFHAKQEAWSFFATLTFSGKVPCPALAYALQCRWLERVAKPILHETPESLLWLSREELGEQTGRFHLHLLLGKIRDAARVNPKTCLALMDQWERVTAKGLGSPAMARVRVFQPNLRGAEYVLKGLEGDFEWSARSANAYEIQKFSDGLGRTVRLARSLVVRWLGEKGNKYGLQARAVRDARRVKCELVGA